MTKENLGRLILESERQMYLTAKTILHNDQDCEGACWEFTETVRETGLVDIRQ